MKNTERSERQLTDMLTEVHVLDIRRIPVDTPNDSGLITGFLSC